jgi:hypothetical protein
VSLGGSSCVGGTLRYSDRVRRVLPLVVLAAGCAGPDGFRADPVALPTADLREQELKDNLRDGLTWEEHERRMAELKGTFGPPADADASGPGKGTPAR